MSPQDSELVRQSTPSLVRNPAGNTPEPNQRVYPAVPENHDESRHFISVHKSPLLFATASHPRLCCYGMSSDAEAFLSAVDGLQGGVMLPLRVTYRKGWFHYGPESVRDVQ
jgi:hypothetical protein